MELEVRINGVVESISVTPQQTLLSLLRQKGCMSVKQGCGTGDCGACMVQVDGLPRPSCVMLASQVGGCTLTTVEGIGTPHRLHPLQEAFREMGAVQCGFCIPGMLVSAHALLQRNPNPTEEEVREALSSNLCRCTGYVKPVQAVLQAAARMRGEQFSGEIPRVYTPGRSSGNGASGTGRASLVTAGTTGAMRPVQARPAARQVIGASLPDIESTKVVTGQPAFTDDVQLQGMLYAAIVHSPHAHAVIRSIDVSEAASLPGVHAVLTYKDIARTPYASGNVTGPADRYSLDYIVRHVGDRVAAVAAETPEQAQQAIEHIRVEYDVLPALPDPRQAIEANAPRIHSESESRGIADARRNIAGRVRLEEGNAEQGFASADVVVEGEYSVPVTHPAPIENHTVITYFDENNNLVVRSATQTPHLIRRTLATLLDMPVQRIRVVQPNIGGSFGTKQGVVLEDICALLTLATHRPVRLAYTRHEEFIAGRVEQRSIMRVKTGVKRDGTLVAQQLLTMTSTGAYATHPLLAENNISPLSLYACQNRRFIAEVVYTTTPPASSRRGWEAALFALECHMDDVAQRLGMDALELRRKNIPNSDENVPLFACIQTVEARLRERVRTGASTSDVSWHRGTGIALSHYRDSLHDVSGATIMLNEGGAFDIFITGADDTWKTMLVQIAAEALGVPVDTLVLHTVETSTLPFSTVSDATSTLISAGNAIQEAATQLRQRLLALVCEQKLIDASPDELTIEDGAIVTPRGHAGHNGQKLLLQQVAEQIIIVQGKHVIASASGNGAYIHSFATHKAEVEVNVLTGVVRVVRIATAIDGGRIINPLLIEGQVQGAIARAINATMSEELLYDKQGQPFVLDFSHYTLYRATDMPQIQVALVESEGATGPFGAKPVLEVATSGIAAAIVNAIANATSLRLRQLPVTPERVLHTRLTQEARERV